MFKGLVMFLFLFLGMAVRGQVISIEASDPTASEAGSDPGRFRVFTNFIFSGTSPITVAYTVSTTSGSAVGGTDYTALTGTVILPSIVVLGSSQNFIDITGIVDDVDIEGDESVIVTLTGASAGTIASSPGNTATVTIEDNDASVEFSTATNSDVENTGGNLPGLIVNGSVATATSVTVSDAGTGTATVGTDYNFGNPQVVNIPQGEYDGTAVIPIPTLSITPDTQIESDETIDLALSVPSPSTSLVLGTQQTTTYTILNDDTATITISDISGAEDSGSITVTATLDNPVAGGFTVEVSTSDGTATLVDSDYTAVTGQMLTFSGTAVETQTFSVVPTADTKVEDDETVIIAMSNLANTVLGSDIDISDTGTITITNDDLCAAGTGAPQLIASVPTNFCDLINQNLNNYTNTSAPANSVLTWSTNSDPLVIADHLTKSTVSTAGTYYGFFYDVANNCASDTLQVILTLSTSPSAGTPTNASACSVGNNDVTRIDLDNQLTGTVDSGSWAFIPAPGQPNINIDGQNRVQFKDAPDGTYEFTYTTNTAVAPCINVSSSVRVSVTDCTIPCIAGTGAPVIDTSMPTAFCGVILQNLDEYTNSVPPAGTELIWSTNSDPTVANAHINSDVDAPGTYYGFFYDAANNCGSPVLRVDLTINFPPGKPNATPGFRCGTGTITLGATRETPGSVLNWYDSETGGTSLGTGTSFVTPSIAATTTFYVEAVANSCPSERTAVVATIYEQPDPGIANNTTACSVAGGFTTVDLNSRLTGADSGTWAITAPVPSGATVNIGPDGIVDFVGQPDGDYIFAYTTNTAQAPCTDSSTTLTVSVSPTDCAPDDIDLELIKKVDKNSVDVGSQVTFTLTVTNLSDVQASNIIVTDSLGISFGFAYVTSSTSKGTYNDITGEWTVDTLEPQETITLEIIASVPVEGTFTNRASITDSFPNDGNLVNNESSVEVEVLPTVCLRIFNQISPNGDGINDELIINCITNYKNNKLEIFDRYGNKVFSTINYDNTWSGTGKNGDLPKGTYFYSLDLGDGSAARTGWIQIIR